MPRAFEHTPADEMKAYPVAELAGGALDAAVELALGHTVVYRPHYLVAHGITLKQLLWAGASVVDPERLKYAPPHHFRPVKGHSSDWLAAGPAIDAEEVMFYSPVKGTVVAYFARSGPSGPSASGPNHLVAAARLRVLSVLGPEVPLPVALVEGEKAPAA